MSFSNYYNLKRPLTAKWIDGRTVTVYPDGKVEDRNTGEVIRQADRQEKVNYSDCPTSSLPDADRLLLLALTGVIIIGIIAISRK